jgi:hypothetical protein
VVRYSSFGVERPLPRPLLPGNDADRIDRQNLPAAMSDTVTRDTW